MQGLAIVGCCAPPLNGPSLLNIRAELDEKKIPIACIGMRPVRTLGLASQVQDTAMVPQARNIIIRSGSQPQTQPVDFQGKKTTPLGIPFWLVEFKRESGILPTHKDKRAPLGNWAAGTC